LDRKDMDFLEDQLGFLLDEHFTQLQFSFNIISRIPESNKYYSTISKKNNVF